MYIRWQIARCTNIKGNIVIGWRKERFIWIVNWDNSLLVFIKSIEDIFIAQTATKEIKTVSRLGWYFTLSILLISGSPVPKLHIYAICMTVYDSFIRYQLVITVSKIKY